MKNVWVKRNVFILKSVGDGKTAASEDPIPLSPRILDVVLEEKKIISQASKFGETREN